MVAKTFLEHNFGTDMLLSSWTFLLSAIIYSGIFTYYFIDALEFKDSFFETAIIAIIWISSLIYFIASYVLVLISYEDELQSEGISGVILNTDFNNMSFLERYFTGNSLLVMSWIIFIGTVILLIYPIWGYAAGEISTLYFVVFFIAIMIANVVLLIWVISCLPENLAKNNGRGSCHLFDFFCLCTFLFEKNDKSAFMSDFTFVAWLIALFSILCVPPCIIVLAYYPTSIIDWLWLICSISFAIGSVLFLHVSYPENQGSRTVWKYFHKTKKATSHHSDEEDAVAAVDENTRLL